MYSCAVNVTGWPAQVTRPLRVSSDQSPHCSTADACPLARGFYDRLLAKPPRKTFLLGHAHAFQMVPRLPDEPHDIKVKAVVTPQGVIRCRVR